MNFDVETEMESCEIKEMFCSDLMDDLTCELKISLFFSSLLSRTGATELMMM
jgi:hypothetical protein